MFLFFWAPKMCPCPRNYVPVCGADKKTYSNKCELKCAKVKKLHNGACQRNYTLFFPFSILKSFFFFFFFFIIFCWQELIFSFSLLWTQKNSPPGKFHTYSVNFDDLRLTTEKIWCHPTWMPNIFEIFF